MTKVFVTGASGFIAKHIVRELLEKGYEVRGSVRSERRKAEVEALFPGAALEFAFLDLMKDDGWADAMDGCDVLLHTASPFPESDPKDPQELIRPAVDGTLRALRAATEAGIDRVVLTSSCAAIYKDKDKAPEARSTRANWTDPDGPDTSAYEASKTLAERAAWDYVAEHPEMKLTSINPGGVFGPALDTEFGTSLEIAEQILDGKFPMSPNVDMPIVDVRDVAHMHVNAIDNEATIGERFPANAGAITMLGASQAMADGFPDRKIPTRRMPDWLVRVAAVFVPIMKTVANNLGRTGDVDGSDAERVMDFTYIPGPDALVASGQFILDSRS